MKPDPEKEIHPNVEWEADTDGLLVCPVCESLLSWGDRSCQCVQGHSFDRAREGYANLLLSHCRHSRNPGDNADMIQARRRFLDSGHYAPLSARIQQDLRERLARRDAEDAVNMLDSGCGEGSFLSGLHAVATGSFYGIDVSKEAIRLAAKRDQRSRWLVANIMRKLPFASDSFDMVLSVLAPRNIPEFARVLKANGSLVLVVPGANHLLELRSLLLANAGNAETKAENAVEICEPHFVLQHKESLTYERLLTRDHLADLVQMTPLFWRSTREAKAHISTLYELRVTVDFVLLTFTASPE
ncbi:MAG: methyltransferase domain-containing protein [Kiritimatiellae bacterium]|nr:methyltransferase domain-containing protein [Kiritimatiellia bacterium]